MPKRSAGTVAISPEAMASRLAASRYLADES
ncbi:MAG: MoxR family ATPase, partial [Mesorhizobium sp.]